MNSPGGPSPSFVALGAAVGAADGVLRIAGLANRSARRVARPVTQVTRAVAPGLWDAGERVVAELDRRGRVEAVAALTEGMAFLDAMSERLAGNPALIRVINDVLDPMLPVVLEKLAQDPAPIRQLVSSQSIGMAQEMSDRARVRAAQGDDAIERLAVRLRLRRRTPAAKDPPEVQPTDAPEVQPTDAPEDRSEVTEAPPDGPGLPAIRVTAGEVAVQP